MKRGPFVVLGVLGVALGGVVYLAFREDDPAQQGAGPLSSLSAVEQALLTDREKHKLWAEERNQKDLAFDEQVNQAKTLELETVAPERARDLRSLEEQGLITISANEIKVNRAKNHLLTAADWALIAQFTCEKARDFYGMPASAFSDCVTAVDKRGHFEVRPHVDARRMLEIWVFGMPSHLRNRS